MTRPRPSRWLLVALVVAATWHHGTPSALAAAIRGRVQYVGGPVESKRLPVTVDQFVCGKDKDAEELVLGPQRGIRNAVVSLASAPAGARWEPSPVPIAIDQKGCVFAPRVIIVPVGGTVDFLNSDRLLHNIHSASKVNPVFNRTQPKGRTIPITFTKPEILRIGCDLHGWMRAWVVVAEHPFYAVTGPDGAFSLNNVPAGTHTLSVWQETLGTTTRDITVADTDATIVIDLGRR